jgi:hypothetical protein
MALQPLLKFFFCVHVLNLYTQKPRPNGLALAFQQGKPGQSQHEALITARLGLAYLGLAPASGRAGTALVVDVLQHILNPRQNSAREPGHPPQRMGTRLLNRQAPITSFS